MNRLSNSRGQTLVETSISAILFTSLSVFAFGLILNFMALSLLTRWASNNSRCIAVLKDNDVCAEKTKEQLRKYFGIKEVSVKAFTQAGVIHSEIKAPFIGFKQIVARFDLQPSEYKRVK